MEDIDGGLHPAVDGQSLDEMRWDNYKHIEHAIDSESGLYNWASDPMLTE